MPDCFSSEDISIHHKRVRRSVVPLVQGKPSYGRISEVVAHFPLAHYFLDDGFLTAVVVRIVNSYFAISCVNSTMVRCPSQVH